MEASTLSSPTVERSDVFSISDQALSDRLQFIQEIGFGNWGSVWLCRPKLSRYSSNQGQKIAVKLVHRSKTSTTAARVRSLWNEMKIVRNFKNDPHPSIIPFHSFVLTPSYALITMAYFPTLVPVEVEEFKAREWFRSLLSGVDFLHQRGVVHNDIKPANILLSHKNIPVLVDFGFAEKYELDSPTAFRSSLSYGTPEYLSPERARGIPHDTRKSDVWSLGITFFEVLIGRTPFENTDGEQLSTKDDLEKYWQRTLCGTWIGDWKMTAGMEKLLQCMIAPNADLRCTASQAMADEMWRLRPTSTSSHKREASAKDTSAVFEKIINTTTRSRKAKFVPPGLDSPAAPYQDIFACDISALVKSRSQSKVAANKDKAKKHPHLPPVPDLSPIKASPSTTPLKSAAGKENVVTPKERRVVLASRNGNLPQVPNVPVNRTAKEKQRALGSVVNGCISRTTSCNVECISLTTSQRSGKQSTGIRDVRDRVRDWERERERLREMARLEETERERDEELEKGKQKEQYRRDISIKEHEVYSKENHGTMALNKIVSSSPTIIPPLAQVTNKIPAVETLSIPSSVPDKSFRHAIRSSIDKTLGACKLSALTYGTNNRSTPAHSLDIGIRNVRPEIKTPFARGGSQAQSWINEVNSSLPPANQSETVTTDSRIDRLTVWMQNVERVVEDARQNFAASAKADASFLSLPVAPRDVFNGRSTNGRSVRSSRLPRKVLAASQIFVDYDSLMTDTSSSANTSTLITSDTKSSSCDPPSVSAAQDTPSETMTCTPASTDPAQMRLVVQTPLLRKRATVSENSLVALLRDTEMTPSRRREKSRSNGNFLQQRIASISQIETEINKPIEPKPKSRLSEMFDRSIFIATPLRACESLEPPYASMDDLTSSPYHVEPHPERKITSSDALPDTPRQRKSEGVYDRFLTATSGVKRVGKGYQSDFIPPRPSTSSHTNLRLGAITRRHSRMTPILPPISSEDAVQGRGVSVDEIGVISYGPISTKLDNAESTGPPTVSFMKKAINAMVPSAKRPSRMVVA